jgi:hypothetical protein
MDSPPEGEGETQELEEPMGGRIDYEQALLDPASVFATPEAVLDQAELSDDQKIEILRRWQYDASEDAVAEEEGMVSDPPLLLRRVLLALESLTGGAMERHTPPTKQDGV